jgi:hypothetical protein
MPDDNVVDMNVAEIKKWCLRLGNLNFLQGQVQEITTSLFTNKGGQLLEVLDDINFASKKLLALFGGVIVSSYFKPFILEPTYNDLRAEKYWKSMDSNQFYRVCESDLRQC